MRMRFIGILAIVGAFLVGCGSGTTVESSSETPSGSSNGETTENGTTINHTDKISIKIYDEPQWKGNKVFFHTVWDNLGDLSSDENAYIIMSDGTTEETVGKHTNGTGTRSLICARIGGNTDNYSEWFLDEQISYACQSLGSLSNHNIILHKGKQYSFFIRYIKDGKRTGESEVQSVLEYGDKVLSVQ
jgi:hypothetical protein